MISAVSSAERLSGPVGVCVDRPLLSLDRPFTYELPVELGAGVGSLVQVPFHGRASRGWVLGPTDDLPARMLPVKKVVSPVRSFDDRRLSLFRWMSERYVSPLAAVIGRAVPPRVASEETGGRGLFTTRSAVHPRWRRRSRCSPGIEAGPTCSGRSNTAGAHSSLRPAPEDEQDAAVEAVATCLVGGRRAIVLVPEAVPMPATAASLLEAFGDRAGLFLGGDKRARYRTWLEIAAGRYDVVIGTRPAVFAPVDRLGLVYVARESHAAHREDRAPYYHGRDVALARARLEGAACVLAAACPSAEASALGLPTLTPSGQALAAGGGRAARTGRTCVAARPGARDRAARVPVLTAPWVRGRAGVSGVRRASGVRGLRGAAPRVRGSGQLRRLRGRGSVSRLRSLVLRDAARRRGTRRGVGGTSGAGPRAPDRGWRARTAPR